MNLRRLGSSAALLAALGLALAPMSASATLVQFDPNQNTVKQATAATPGAAAPARANMVGVKDPLGNAQILRGDVNGAAQISDAVPLTTSSVYPVVSATGATVTTGDISFTANSQSVIIDAANYAALSCTFTGTWTGTLQIQWSNRSDGTGAIAGAITVPGQAGATNSDTTQITSNSQFIGNTFGRYAKITTTSWSSGTAVATCLLHASRLPARVVFTGNNSGNAIPTYQLPGGTGITAASGNVANASAVATLAGSASKTTYITGFRCQAAGSTAASVVSLTVAGVITGTMTYTFVFPAGATTAATPVGQDFSTPVPASSTNTAIVVTLPAGGTGNTNASCAAQGFQL